MNTHVILGLVVFVGSDTKIMMNTRSRRVKTSHVESLMNRFILLLLSLLMVMLLIAAVLSMKSNMDYLVGKQRNAAEFVKTMLRYFVMLNPVIPMSIIITLQVVKTISSKMFLNRIDGVNVNSMSLQEELGQIEYVLSDKTGTLTANKMVLKHFQCFMWTVDVGEKKRRDDIRCKLKI